MDGTTSALPRRAASRRRSAAPDRRVAGRAMRDDLPSAGRSVPCSAARRVLRGAGHISINNVTGATSFHGALSGSDPEGGVPHGGFKGGVVPPARAPGSLRGPAPRPTKKSPATHVSAFKAPGIDRLECFSGACPGNVDNHAAASTSALDRVARSQAAHGFFSAAQAPARGSGAGRIIPHLPGRALTVRCGTLVRK